MIAVLFLTGSAADILLYRPTAAERRWSVAVAEDTMQMDRDMARD